MFLDPYIAKNKGLMFNKHHKKTYAGSCSTLKSSGVTLLDSNKIFSTLLSKTIKPFSAPDTGSDLNK